ncbi:fibroblast growth factor receptor-like 1 [Ylistrum balloti]|uniref:fibroblast growth factor receptor-like 1 n=1 Tax=Ylistrum balloti TaxID=509963 RepID=UPI00290589B7|nr:fibroblast growth factor receptor-like 1 [Ylistrum balloti]
MVRMDRLGVLVLLTLGFVTANGPPRLTDKAHFRYVLKVKQTKKIKCPVEGEPAPMIQWLKDGQDINVLWDRYHVLRDGSLRIRDIILEDGGSFVCKAVNGFGSIHVNYTVVVVNEETGMVKQDNNLYPQTPEEDLSKEWSKPKFIQPEKMKKRDYQRPVGSSVRFVCKAVGNPRPQVSWLKDGNSISTDDDNSKRPSWTLKITELKESDSGRYSCVVNNRQGAISYNYSLEVIEKFNEKPVLLKPHPLNTTVEYGETASLQCKVESVVQPHIQWLKRVDDPSEVKNMNTTLRLGGQQFIVLKTGEVWPGPDNTYLNKLVIQKARDRDSGVYICLGANAMGYNVRSAYLTVVNTNPHRSSLDSDSGSSSLPLMIAVPTCIIIIIVVMAIILLQKRKSCNNSSNSNTRNTRFNPVPTHETEPYPPLQNNPATNLHINPMQNVNIRDMYTGVHNPHLIQSSREKLSKNHSIDFYTDISSVSQSRNNPHSSQHMYSY